MKNDIKEEKNFKSMAIRFKNPNIFRSLQIICLIWEWMFKLLWSNRGVKTNLNILGYGFCVKNGFDFLNLFLSLRLLSQLFGVGYILIFPLNSISSIVLHPPASYHPLLHVPPLFPSKYIIFTNLTISVCSLLKTCYLNLFFFILSTYY